MGERALQVKAPVKAGPALAGLSALASAALLGWAQVKPGFGPDRTIARWVEDTIPWLTELSAGLGWPLGQKWPLAVAVLVAVALLSSFRRKSDAMFILGAVAGGVMMDWSLTGLLSSLPPASMLLIYGTFLGGLAVVGHGLLASRGRAALWSVAAVAGVAVMAVAIHVGHLPSAAALSALLALSWLMTLRHLVAT